MGTLFFDITDIIDHAIVDKRVSGIQRVQVRLIDSLRRKQGSQRIAAIFLHPETRQVVCIDPLDVFSQEDFNAARLLHQLKLAPTGILPHKKQIKAVLRRYDHSKWQRTFKKMEIYLRAVFRPASLEGLGLHPKRISAPVEALPISPLRPLTSQDSLIFLGTNWQSEDMIPLARQHAQQGGQVLQMIYDLIPVNGPQWCPEGTVKSFNSFLRRSPEFVTRYPCISDATRQELLAYMKSLGVARSAHTVRLAHEFAGFERDARIDPAPLLHIPGMMLERPYVLFVGTIENRKNVLSLLRVWKALAHELGTQTPQLVLGGKRGHDSGEFFSMLEQDPRLQEHIKIAISPDDATLATLYSNALFTIYPSFYEGWGLPVGESAWFGKLCVTSSCSSLPEVCGDLADYADPADVSSILAAVRRVIMDADYRTMREQHIKAASLRCWDDVADDLFQYATNTSAHTIL